MTKTVTQSGNTVYVACPLCDKHWVQSTAKTIQKLLQLHYKVSHPKAPAPLLSLTSKKCDTVNYGEGLRQMVSKANTQTGINR